MSIVMFFTSLLNVWAEFYQHNIRNVIGLLLLLLLVVVMGGAYNIADEDNYIMYYYASKYFTGDIDPIAALYFHYNMDLGYTLTNNIFYNCGFSYYEYKFIITTLLLIIIFFISRKLTPAIGIVLFFYYRYPFFFDVAQVRNFIVEVLLLISLAVYSEKKSSRILSLCIVLLAATFHKIALVYLVIMIVWILRKFSVGNLILKVFLIIGIAMPIYANFIVGSLSEISNFIASMDNFSQYAAYANREMRLGFLIPYFHVMSLAGVVWYIRKNINSNKYEDFINIIYISYLGMIILLPLMAIHGDFNRIPRNLLLPTYIAFAIYLEQLSSRWLKMKMFIVFFVLMYIITYSEFYILPELAILPTLLMQNNFILETIYSMLY